MFTRRFDRGVAVIGATLLGSFLFGTAFAAYALWPSRRSQGYQPNQPIEFPHDVMAGKAEIPCLYCHVDAEREAVASIPAVEVCLNCHAYVRPKAPSGEMTPRMKALFRYVDEATNVPLAPIPWIKVHDVSDFAYFDHGRHTVGAQLACRDCHGDVDRMRQVRRVHPLTMGWCLDCHRRPPRPERADGRETDGPTTCSTCHR